MLEYSKIKESFRFVLKGFLISLVMKKYILNAALILSLTAQFNMVQPLVLAQIEPELIWHDQILATSISQDLVIDYKPATRKVIATGYSSTPDQTDDSPFYTASGKHVRDGFIAANFLKFGTRVKIPAMFGDKVFVVEDRMHPRFSNRVDIWFATRSEAYKFGKREVEIVVL